MARSWPAISPSVSASSARKSRPSMAAASSAVASRSAKCRSVSAAALSNKQAHTRLAGQRDHSTPEQPLDADLSDRICILPRPSFDADLSDRVCILPWPASLLHCVGDTQSRGGRCMIDYMDVKRRNTGKVADGQQTCGGWAGGRGGCRAAEAGARQLARPAAQTARASARTTPSPEPPPAHRRGGPPLPPLPADKRPHPSLHLGRQKESR